MLSKKDVTILREMFGELASELKRDIRDEMHSLLSASEARMNVRMNTFEVRMDAMEQRMDAMEQRLIAYMEAMEERIIERFTDILRFQVFPRIEKLEQAVF